MHICLQPWTYRQVHRNIPFTWHSRKNTSFYRGIEERTDSLIVGMGFLLGAVNITELPYGE